MCCKPISATSFTGVFPFAKSKYVSRAFLAPGDKAPTPDYKKMREDLRNAVRNSYIYVPFCILSSNFIYLKI